jgi:hypothetical protein
MKEFHYSILFFFKTWRLLCHFIFGCKNNKIQIVGIESEETKRLYVLEKAAGISSPSKVLTGK